MTNSTPIIRTAIVEDDDRIRQMLVVLLEGTPGFRCVAAYADAETALIDLPIKQPELVLCDIQLPGLSGIELVKLLKEQDSSIDFIMLTVYEDTSRIVEALEVGAVGYLIKSTSPVDLIQALKEASMGGSPMSAPIARKVVQLFRKSAPRMVTAESLTERENEILVLLAQGFTYQEIGQQLFISRDTVHSHIRSIYKKMQVRSRTEAVVKFLER